ncbi:MAG: HEAT repeat domain-containing protein [bacterium]
MKKCLVAVLLLAGCQSNPPDSSVPATAATTAKQVAATAAQVQIEVETKPAQTQGLNAGTPEQQELLARAKVDFMNNDWDQAQGLFEKLATTGPVSGPQVTAMIALAEIYKDKGLDSKASALYMDLLARAPNVAEVQFIAGRYMAENGQTSNAIPAYERAIELDSNYLQAYVELGGLYVKAGREEDANKIFLRYEQRIYAISKVLEDKKADPAEKLEILEILSFVKDDRANQAIMGALGDPAPEVRERAVTLAEEFGIGESQAVIEKLAVEDEDMRVRMAAKAALERVKGASPEGSRPTFVQSPSDLPKP